MSGSELPSWVPLVAALGASATLVVLHGGLWLGKRDDRLHLYGLAWYLVSVLYLGARLVQRTTESEYVAQASARFILSLAMVDILVAVALSSDLSGRVLPGRTWRALAAFTASMVLALWATPWVVTLDMSWMVEADGTRYRVPHPGPLLVLTTLYGALALSAGARWVWRSPSLPRTDRMAMGVGLMLTVLLSLQDTLLMAGLIRTVHMTDYLTLTLGLGITIIITTRYNRLRLHLADEVALRTQALGHANVALRDALAHSEASLTRVERSEQRMRRLLQELPDAVLVHRDGRVLLVNRAAESILNPVAGTPSVASSSGSDPGLGLRVVDLGLPPAFADNPPNHGELTLQRVDHRTLTLETRTVTTELDGLPAYVSLLRDLTERRQMEARLVTADRMASLGTMAAGVAHELNNPLTFVWGNLDVMREALEGQRMLDVEAPGGVTVRECMDDMLEGLQRVKTIVGDLRAFSRPDDGERTAVDMAEVIRSAVKMTHPSLKHHVQVVLELTPTPTVRGNATRLGQVMVNLLMNAAQAMRGRSGVRNVITIRCCSPDGLHVQVEVQDNGPGISPAHLPRIFDPFFTTKPVGEGTGLGLSICHGIVRAMGGTLSVESTLGAGAHFTVRIPVEAGSGRQVRLLDANRDGGGDTMHVLVVDDEPGLRTVIARVLSGMHVTTVDGMAAAMAHLQTHPSPDLILCDVVMPGQGGLDLLEGLRRHHPHLVERVLLMTGGTPQSLALPPQQEVLAKPFTKDQLLQHVERRRGITPSHPRPLLM